MSQYFALLLLIAAPWPVQDADPIKTLIAQLGDESGAVRAAALQALIASGPTAIPRLRDALNSQDAEVQQRAMCALGELELAQKLAGVMQSRSPVTLSFQNAPFAQVLQDIARQAGVQFEGAVTGPDCRITATFTRAPLMQVLDVLAAAAGMQWSFDDETTVCWRKNPPLLRPNCYSAGFRVTLSRIDVYRSWNYLQSRGLMWMFLETRTEPGIRPIGSPRFEVSDIRDEAGNELSREAEMQDCSPKGYPPDWAGWKSGAVYESMPFAITPLDRAVKKFSKISGQVIFLFPLDKAPLEITDLCEETSVTRGELVFTVSEILTSSLKLTLTSNGNLSHLIHHVDADSLVLIDADGREHVQGTDFDVRTDPMSVDTLRYCVTFNKDVCFQPVALRFMTTGRFFEKTVPFEFKDVDIP
jgi:hypothetical protein